MKKHPLLLLLVIAIAFTGGIAAEILFTKITAHQNRLSIDSTRNSKIKLPLKQKPEEKALTSKVVIGYVQDFRDPNMVQYNNLSHVIFSFAYPTKDGHILLNGKMASDNLREIILKAHQHGTKAILGVGGWYHILGGESYGYFKSAITNPVYRTRLVNELSSITERRNLDGIDIDFEHPHSKADAQNLTAFIKALSQKLHANKKELSVAVHSKIDGMTCTVIHYVVYEPEMFRYVDHVNIMAYDGQWDGGYHAANLSPYPFTEKVVNYWARLFESSHISKEKLVLGVPSYGQPENLAIKQVSYGAIIKNNPTNADRDSVKMNGTIYYYNGAKTVQRKTKLALDHGFGGMMLWESGLDALGSSSLTGTISRELENNNITYQKRYALNNEVRK
ncbi:MAG: glycoside hydrolase family 18 protein [Bacillota bacterium]|nr:glycoside hydrolase family 18 protein [Bacillota bacterium]